MTNAQKVILVIIAGFLSLSLLSWFPDPQAKDVVRFVINAFLCWFLWRSANWARWVLGVLAAIACIFALTSVLRAPMQAETIGILSAMIIFYGFSAYVLLSRKWIGTHFPATTPDKLLQPIERDDAL